MFNNPRPNTNVFGGAQQNPPFGGTQGNANIFGSNTQPQNTMFNTAGQNSNTMFNRRISPLKQLPILQDKPIFSALQPIPKVNLPRFRTRHVQSDGPQSRR